MDERIVVTVGAKVVFDSGVVAHAAPDSSDRAAHTFDPSQPNLWSLGAVWHFGLTGPGDSHSQEFTVFERPDEGKAPNRLYIDCPSADVVVTIDGRPYGHGDVLALGLGPHSLSITCIDTPKSQAKGTLAHLSVYNG